MPIVPAKSLGEVPAGSIAAFEHSQISYALCNVAGTIYCTDGLCPHLQGPLTEGSLHGVTLICPWHGWEFDVRTGAAEVGDDCRLNTYPATVKDGQIFVQVP